MASFKIEVIVDSKEFDEGDIADLFEEEVDRIVRNYRLELHDIVAFQIWTGRE